MVETKAHNALYERPATLSLLPPVYGKMVLDAGRGPSVYARWLLDHGAKVVGFDVSAKMVALAQQRVGDEAVIHTADLRTPLDFAAPESFDVVLCALALEYVRDWRAPVGEFYRLLERGGVLVFSISHPYADFDRHKNQADYFQIEALEEIWRGFGGEVVVPFYRQPFSAVINPLLSCGFSLEEILEPQPLESFEAEDPEDYARLMKQPGFLCVRARKP
jgi:SAM-dependent methyltransferase